MAAVIGIDVDDINVRPLRGWRRKLQLAQYGLFRVFWFMAGIWVEIVGEQVQKIKKHRCKRDIFQY